MYLIFSYSLSWVMTPELVFLSWITLLHQFAAFLILRYAGRYENTFTECRKVGGMLFPQEFVRVIYLWIFSSCHISVWFWLYLSPSFASLSNVLTCIRREFNFAWLSSSSLFYLISIYYALWLTSHSFSNQERSRKWFAVIFHNFS